MIDTAREEVTEGKMLPKGRKVTKGSARDYLGCCYGLEYPQLNNNCAPH